MVDDNKLIVVLLTIAGSGHGFLDGYFQMIPPEGRISVLDSKRNSSSVVNVTDQPSVVEYQDEIPPEIHGYVILANPINACKRVKPPPRLRIGEENFWRKSLEQGPLEKEEVKMDWILLASKSNCSYDTKIDHADAAGFGGILIFNVGSNETEVIGLDEEKGKVPFDSRIPSFFIGAYDGGILESLFRNDSRRRYSIVIETSPPYLKEVINYMLWTSLGLFIFILIICLVKPVYDCVLQPWIRVRYRHRRKMLLAQAVTSLAVVEWKEEMLEKYETCVICMEHYGDLVHLRILPCNHGFHTNCIDSWLLKVRRVCPICKQKIPFSSCWEEFSDSDISEGNYFTDFAYEPLTRRRTNTENVFESFERRDFVNLGRDGSGNESSLEDSIGSNSLRFETDDEDGTTGQATTSASFVSTTVSVHHQVATRSRRLSSSESVESSGSGPNQHGFIFN